MRGFSIPIAFLLAALISGCIPPTAITVHPLVDQSNRTPSTHVDVYTHPDSLTREFRELAIIAATDVERAYKTAETHPEMIEALIEKAKELGANAIVIISERDPRMLSGGERPRSGERIELAIGRAGEDWLPTATWEIRVLAVEYL